jgi:Acetyltransferase (GNAT) domain
MLEMQVPGSLQPRVSRSDRKNAAETSFRVVVIRNAAGVRELQHDVEDLLQRIGKSEDITGAPAYFLAMARQKNSRPLMIAIYDGTKLAGVVYGLNYCFCGLPMGLIECGDACGDGSIFAEEKHFNRIVEIALGTIRRERFTWLARLSWISSAAGQPNDAPELDHPGKMEVRTLNVDEWNHLRLEPSYQAFLKGLGSQTRRNMRYYRRGSEQMGWVFLSEVDMDEASAAIHSLSPLQGIGWKDQEKLDRFHRRVKEVPGGFFSGLRAPNGEWISIVGGWVKDAHLFILFQLNNANHAKASVSTVLRSYVIENAIESGIRHMKTIDGCGGILRKYCHVRATHVLLQRRNYFGRLGVRIFCRLFPIKTISKLFKKLEKGDETSASCGSHGGISLTPSDESSALLQ